MTDNLIEVVKLRKEFGGLVATNDIDFTIPRGSIVSLIGPNGAGKTTFFNQLTGVYKPTSGSIVFDGVDVSDKPPHAITALGIGRTFQNIRLFMQMTALENVLVGMHCRLHGGILGSIVRTPKVRREEAEAREKARELLVYSGLPRRHEEQAGSLPVRRPAPARGRARARDRPEAAAARRADRRHEPAGDRGVHRVRPPRARREGADGAADRARHEGRDGRLRALHRARVRREDRRGHARRGAGGRARDRGLSRQGGDRHEHQRRRPRDQRHPHLLRRHPRAQGRVAAGRRERDRDADRRERRRQVDDAALDQRPQPPAAGHDHVPGARTSRTRRRTRSSRAGSPRAPRAGGCSPACR